MNAPRVTRHFALRRRGARPVWASLLLRVGLAFALIGVALAVHWFDREGLRDNVDGTVSFTDLLYFTMITVTTVGFGDIVPVTDRARMFDTFVVTPVRLFVWLLFLGTAYDFILKRTWERFRMSLIQRNLRDHVVVVGFGTSGAEAVRELMRRGTDPRQIVVIDTDVGALQEAEACGVAVLEADGTRNATLEAVAIARARALIVASGRDDTSILIVLTAHGLAAHVPVSVVVRSADNEPLARQAGADTVINPASFAGLLLAGSTHGSHIADYLADLAAHGGRVALNERPVAPGEVGHPLAAIATGLGVRLYRDDVPHGFASAAAKALLAGDVIVEIVSHHNRPTPAV